MKQSKALTGSDEGSPLALAKKQRSHNLYVWSNPMPDQNDRFLEWYKGDYLQTLLKQDHVLAVQQFEQHPQDVCGGQAQPIGYRYLGVYELSLDGAEEAADLIDQITTLHKEQPSADAPATWLYYPVSEKVGLIPETSMPFMTLAFSSPLVGREAPFREWYSTQHIRHALNVPGLINGQRFELTGFQQPGATEPDYESIAVYEQHCTPDQMIKSIEELVAGGVLYLSETLDLDRFTEWVYCPLTDRLSNHDG